jgi:hypothetical protein
MNFLLCRRPQAISKTPGKSLVRGKVVFSITAKARTGVQAVTSTRAGVTAMAHDRLSTLKYIGEEYSRFWAAAEKVAAFTAICVLTLLLISIEIDMGVQPPSPSPEEFLFY